MYATTDLVLGAIAARATATVDVPEWGEGVKLNVRGMTAAESPEWLRISKERPQDELLHVVTVGACDEHGKPLFSAEHLPQLRELPAGIVSRIAQKVFALSGLESADAKNP